MNTNRNGCDNVLDVPTDDSFGQPLTDGTIMVSMNNKAVLDYILLLQIEDQISITSNMYYHKSNVKDYCLQSFKRIVPL